MTAPSAGPRIRTGSSTNCHIRSAPETRPCPTPVGTPDPDNPTFLTPQVGPVEPVPAAARVDPELACLLAPPQSADEVGRLGGYRVLDVLGAGGMGAVFAAEDPALGR